MKIGRNDPCPCGSGKKYKHCCYEKDSVKQEVPAEPEADESAPEDASATDGADATPTDAQEHKKQTSRHKDRSRFQGESRGGTAAFKPRATRSSQRGS